MMCFDVINYSSESTEETTANGVRSYVPEGLMLEGKDQTNVPLFSEDCMVVDPASAYRLLSWRGKGLTQETTMAEVCKLSATELRFLESALPQHRRVLLLGKEGAVLCFGEWLTDTGLLLAVRFSQDPRTVCRNLSLLCRDAALSPAFSHMKNGTDEEEEQAYQSLRRTLAAADRLLAGETELGELCRMAAAFAGCRLQENLFPRQGVDLTLRDRHRLTAFLICVFFSARSWSGEMRAEGDPLSFLCSASYHCRVELLQGEDDRSNKHFSLPFLSFPAFSDYTAQITPQGIVLEASLERAQTETAVHGNRLPRTTVRLELQLIESETE